MRFDPRVAVIGPDDPVGHQADVLLDFLFLEAATDQTLHCEQRIPGIGDGLASGGRPDEYLVVIEIRDHRRRRTGAFRVFNHFDLLAFHQRHA
ncbi:hypothetical protein OKW34_003984 [Paraburkholderia youngii]